LRKQKEEAKKKRRRSEEEAKKEQTGERSIAFASLREVFPSVWRKSKSQRNKSI